MDLTLTPQLAITLATNIIGVAGAYFALKYKLDSAIAKLDALHNRIDEMEDNYNTLNTKASNQDIYIADLRAWKHKEGDSMNAFKMARELLREERLDK